MSSYRELPVSRFAIKFHAAVPALLMAGAAGLAFATPPAAPGNSSYLALGDSIAFGLIATPATAVAEANRVMAGEGESLNSPNNMQ